MGAADRKRRGDGTEGPSEHSESTRRRHGPDIATMLGGEPFDLLVIGAGINGAGIARDAALRGLRVALLDKGDIASGTTSWSSRLIHGGLRYLEYGEIGLVRESLHERETLLYIAAHLVHPLPLMIPIYDADRRGQAPRAPGHDRLRRAQHRQVPRSAPDAVHRRGAGAGTGAGG